MGGAQKMMADILSHLDTRTYDLHLLILADFADKDSFHSLIPTHITVHQLSITSPYDLRGWGQAIRFLRTLRPATIVSNLYLTNTVMRVAAAFLRIPVIVVEHNTYKDKNFFQHSVDWALSFVSFKIIAVSKGVADYIHIHQHISQKKIEVIPNGLDIRLLRQEKALQTRESARDAMGIASQEFVLLHVGRLVSQKDPSLLLAGFALFAKKSETLCRLIMVGGGPLMESLIDQANELGIQEKVVFTGACNPNPYYMASDIFISTSLIEGFGLVRAEALWYGLPVVTTITGGTSELIQDGETGAHVLERTPQAVAEGIRRVLAMNSQQVRNHAHEVAERFTIEKTVSAYARIIDQSLKQ